MFEVRLISKADEWESFVLSQPWTLFVQSAHYGDFYRTLGEDAWCIGIYQNEMLVGGSLVVSTHAKRGSFLYLPYGPILPDEHAKKAGDALFAFLASFGKEQGYAFIKASPFLDNTEEHRRLFRSWRFRPAPLHVLAETTWLLDVTPDEETILCGMKKNHRNLIRRCEREGVRIETSTNPDDLAGLNDLLDETAKRHKFVRFSRSYIQKEFEAFAGAGEALLFHAYLPDGRLDASSVFMYYGTMGAYRQSASLNLDKRLPTSYLLQWEAIKEGKKRGMQWHNFWGIAPGIAPPSHPFAGIRHFKTGFGGFQKDVLPCHDMPLSPLYWANWTVDFARKIYRGF